MEDYLRGTLADLDSRAAAVVIGARVVLGLATAWYDEVSPEQAEELITRALGNGADGVALQSLPYWRQEEDRRFYTHYLPRSVTWASLWDYDATPECLFRGPAAPDPEGPVAPDADAAHRRTS